MNIYTERMHSGILCNQDIHAISSNNSSVTQNDIPAIALHVLIITHQSIHASAINMHKKFIQIKCTTRAAT